MATTQKLITLKSYFNSIYESVPADLVRMMMRICSYILVFVFSSFRHLIEHLAGSWKVDDHVEVLGESVGLNEEEEKSEFSFGFQFQMKEDDLFGYRGIPSPEVKLGKTGDNGLSSVTTTSKYQFVSVQDFGGFVAEPKSATFTVHEVFVEPTMGNDFIVKEDGLVQDFGKVEVQQHAKIVDELKELDENSNLSSNGKLDDFIENEVSTTDSIISEEEFEKPVADESSRDKAEDVQEKSELNLGKNEQVLKSEKVNWLGDFFIRNDSFCYGFDSFQESDFESLDHHQEDSADGSSSVCAQQVDSVIEQELENLSPSVPEEIADDCIELEPNLEKEEYHSESDVEHESGSFFLNTMESQNELMDEEESEVKSWEFDSDDEEEEDADILLEHQELIGQMKMELRNIRTGGLPTILEEVETPRMKQDYKPLKSLKINEKLEHRDQMAEIQKFYKSYNEKMRKLDILNYQTLQAINFLRMKHPEQLNTGENESLSAIKSVVFPSLWPCKLRRIYADPTLKSITELHKDLEIVYVGQACLSWEILHWQYKKAKELQLYDPQGFRSYNQIAIEFQQFHVLLKRFTEDELFQGPRVQNYTKQRCNLRGLLQVPAIRDDSMKDKKARRKEEGDAVPISTMTKIIKESMTVFWEFIHTDKDTTNLFLTIILQGSKAHLQDPADSDLFMQIKTIHQKKERRLKDLLRTGNCIVKKFQKQQETILDQHMFVSQVELRLISRVLNLPRLSRDQLLWCHSKLNNIIFIDGKIQVEDSLFLIFPC